MRIRYDADVSILNMGFLRSDTIHSAGPISIKTLNKMVPVLDGICLLEVSGKELLNTLEIGVSKWPGYDGRFPSVSGIKFTLDGNKPPMQRITKIEMDQGFELEKKYRLSVKAFLAAGKHICANNIKILLIFFYFFFLNKTKQKKGKIKIKYIKCFFFIRKGWL